MQDRIIKFGGSVGFSTSASAVGGCEHKGPIGDCFDIHDETDRFGKSTWEKAESEMQRLALNTALSKAKLAERDIDALFAGDLLNQCVGSSYGLLDFDIPYFGLYGACSTAVEGIILAAALCSAEHAARCAVVTSSHNSAAERQYRTPIEYGGQRSPTAQWTVTGAGAFVIEKNTSVEICEAMAGIVIDKGITDASNMGAAMAPAAISTLTRYFKASDTTPEDFDLILTGDLGFEGGSILCELMQVEGYDIKKRYNDCGMLIYDREAQDMHAGGSGCGCSAVVLASYILPKLARGELSDILVIGTGAMMSPSSVLQGESIPAIAHLARLRSRKKES